MTGWTQEQMRYTGGQDLADPFAMHGGYANTGAVYGSPEGGYGFPATYDGRGPQAVAAGVAPHPGFPQGMHAEAAPAWHGEPVVAAHVQPGSAVAAQAASADAGAMIAHGLEQPMAYAFALPGGGVQVLDQAAVRIVGHRLRVRWENVVPFLAVVAFLLAGGLFARDFDQIMGKPLPAASGAGASSPAADAGRPAGAAAAGRATTATAGASAKGLDRRAKPATAGKTRGRKGRSAAPRRRAARAAASPVAQRPEVALRKAERMVANGRLKPALALVNRALQASPGHRGLSALRLRISDRLAALSANTVTPPAVASAAAGGAAAPTARPPATTRPPASAPTPPSVPNPAGGGGGVNGPAAGGPPAAAGAPHANHEPPSPA